MVETGQEIEQTINVYPKKVPAAFIYAESRMAPKRLVQIINESLAIF